MSIMFVGEAYGEEEERQGRPFVGASGWLLKGMAKEAGIPLEKCPITNVVNLRPPHNKISEWFYGPKDAKREGKAAFGLRYPNETIQSGLRSLARRIQSERPTVIVALGATALWALTGFEGINKWRGSIIRNPQGPVFKECNVTYHRHAFEISPIEDTVDIIAGYIPQRFQYCEICKCFPDRIIGQEPLGSPPVTSVPSPGGSYTPIVVPCFHPAEILRTWGDRWITVHDFNRARKLDAGEIRPNQWKVITRPSFHDVCDWIVKAHNVGPLAVDIETRGNSIACIGLGFKNEAICIPILCTDKVEGYWSAEDEAFIIARLKGLLTKRLCIFHNALFDMQFIAKEWGFVPNLYMDTMIAHHVCFPGITIGGTRGKGKSLDLISSIYCEDYRYWKDDGKTWVPGMPEDILWSYNCEDVLRTYECANEIQKVIYQFGLVEQNQFQHSLVTPFFKAMLRGIAVHVPELKRLSDEIADQQKDYLKWFETILGHPFNPRSHKQMVALFYEDFRCKPIVNRKTKKVTLDDDALVLIGKRDPLLKPLTDKMIEYSRSITFRSTFLQAGIDEDGHARGSYNITGTETFRTSSGENPFGSGLNLQNIPGEPKK